jgi:hypothetical protein
MADKATQAPATEMFAIPSLGVTIEATSMEEAVKIATTTAAKTKSSKDETFISSTPEAKADGEAITN